MPHQKIRAATVLGAAAVIALPAIAGAQLVYSYETLYNAANQPDPLGTRPDGFRANGGGVIVTQDTIGATDQAKSMRVSIVQGATFVGALTEVVSAAAPVINSASNTAIEFDLTVPSTGQFAGAFARIGITEFGNNPTQTITGGSVQTVGNAERNFSLEPGTYRIAIPLIARENPVTFDTGPDFRGIPFSQIFGANTDNQLQETTSFQFYLNKSNDSAALVYIDNVRAVNQGASYHWSADADADWTDNSRWMADVPVANLNTAPNVIDANAIIGAGITAPRTITVTAPVTVGSITFENSNSYSVAGASTLTLNVSSGASGLTVNRGFHTISAPLVLSDDTIVRTPPGTAVLQTSALQPTTKVITKTGLGTFSVNNIRAGGLVVNQGVVSVGTAGTNAGTSRVGTLAITGARVDLNDNDLIVTNSSYNAVTSLISSARNGGSWNGNGLTSSTAGAATPKNKTLGTVTGTQYLSLGQTTFDGFNVAASDVLVKFTYYGDTDLNGIVNFDDYARTDAGFNSGGTTWFQGDNDYNGSVNFDDYALIDLGFNTQSGTLIRAMDWLEGEDRSMRGMDDPALQKVVEHFAQFGNDYATSFLNAVPEPTSAGVFAGVQALACMRIRRRRDR